MPNTDPPPLKRLRPPVIKSESVTSSEGYLAKLAEKSFLSLWTYPNPFRDQKQSGTGDGKELCDLLVVCDSHIIIFSDKSVSWPSGDLHLAWSRWAKRAIRDAAKQAEGAERWITKFPDRIYLDRACKQRFPISLPLAKERIIHRVVVAIGAEQPCREHTSNRLGSLIIRPDIKGEEHWINPTGQIHPFMVGDIDPHGSFVHVINRPSLDIMMSELDTIGDFVDYLDKKANFVRSGRLLQADGEENLVAYYATRVNRNGEHDFVTTSNVLTINNSHYESFINSPGYIAKKEADNISYFWDRWIEEFSRHMLGGTSVTLGKYDFKLKNNELCVRYMALERRFPRRIHSELIMETFKKSATTKKSRCFQLMIKPAGAKNNETAFFILTLRRKESFPKEKKHKKYRIKRMNTAQKYAFAILERYSYLERVIVISCEPIDQTDIWSDDIIYVEQAPWTEDERRAIREDCRNLGIFRDDMMRRRSFSPKEYPI